MAKVAREHSEHSPLTSTSLPCSRRQWAAGKWCHHRPCPGLPSCAYAVSTTSPGIFTHSVDAFTLHCLTIAMFDANRNCPDSGLLQAGHGPSPTTHLLWLPFWISTSSLPSCWYPCLLPWLLYCFCCVSVALTSPFRHSYLSPLWADWLHLSLLSHTGFILRPFCGLATCWIPSRFFSLKQQRFFLRWTGVLHLRACWTPASP